MYVCVLFARARVCVHECAVGRYLVIRIDALDGTLTLCEVKVFAPKEVPSKYINHAVLYFRLLRCGVTLFRSFS